MLTDRLARLVDEGILRKEPYRPEGQRTRHEYRLTTMGFDLYPVMVAVSQWGDRYLAGPEGPPVEFAHRDCGSRSRSASPAAPGTCSTTPVPVVPRPSRGARAFAG